MNFTWSKSGGEMKMGSISCCISFHCSTVSCGVLHRLVMQWKNCLVIYSDSRKQPGVMLFVLREVVNDEWRKCLSSSSNKRGLVKGQEPKENCCQLIIITSPCSSGIRNYDTKELWLLFTITDRYTYLISISMPKASYGPIAICVSSSCFSWVWLGMGCLLVTYFLTCKRRPATFWSNHLFSHKQQQQQQLAHTELDLVHLKMKTTEIPNVLQTIPCTSEWRVT